MGYHGDGELPLSQQLHDGRRYDIYFPCVRCRTCARLCVLFSALPVFLSLSLHAVANLPAFPVRVACSKISTPGLSGWALITALAEATNVFNNASLNVPWFVDFAMIVFGSACRRACVFV